MKRRTKHLDLLPRPDFELSPHVVTDKATGKVTGGRWFARVNGRRCYFGDLGDPEGALKRYKEELPALERGIQPGAGEGMTVRELVNRFLAHRLKLVEDGDLAEITWQAYRDTAADLIEFVGRTTMVADLTPDLFGQYRNKLSKRYGTWALLAEIRRVRAILNFGHKGLPKQDRTPVAADLCGDSFNGPSSRRIEEVRNKPRSFTAKEVRAILAECKPTLRAAVLLGLNAAYGNNDIAGLRHQHIDLRAGVAQYRRQKTGVMRRAPLWPETVEALKLAGERRARAKSNKDSDRVFLTTTGAALVRFADSETTTKRHRLDQLAWQFTQAMKRAGVDKPQVGFYGLRRCFETIGGGAGDQVAVDFIMGHRRGIAAQYVDWAGGEGDERLRQVTGRVRAWLFADNAD